MENKLPDLIYEQLKINPPENRRILSIQSHVVHGYAGNKCSIFPMQLHGYEVDPINCVQYSNHSAYKFMKGQKLDSVQLSNIYEGLKLNQINSYSHVLTGYCSNISFLKEVVNIVKDLKQKNPDILFYCDPVLGDNGRYYVPEEMMPVYRDILVPLADLISPNIFELS
uniref:pyridoxal kinase n=1 Tax=Setaria digitata TaxID=48799 RepID=A0A915PRD8_9BILA